MAGTSGPSAWLIGGVLCLGVPVGAGAQESAAQPVPALNAVARDGSMAGVVHSDQGDAIVGAVVSIVGEASTFFAVTDKDGRFAVPSLPPGAYLVRAHGSGYTASKAQAVAVTPGNRSSSIFSMRRADGAVVPVLAAGLGLPVPVSSSLPPGAESESIGDPASTTDPKDDHSETAWRVRHVRRGVLRDASAPLDAMAEDDADGHQMALLLRESSSSRNSRPVADSPFSGQVNFLTANSFDSPQELLSGISPARSIAYVKVGAPIGDRGDWMVRGALTEGDLASWVVAGAYKTRASVRNAYDVGMSYSTQRYGGGNPLALREVSDGSRNAGTLYAFDTFNVIPAVSVTYGATYARYDYLEDQGLLSPRATVALKAGSATRLSFGYSSRADAPGAGEFLPSLDEGIWLPPQRTFSSAEPGRPMSAERTTQLDAQIERDLGAATVALRAFHQQVNGQLLTVFGTDMANFPGSRLGHYVVGQVGDAEATGGTVSVSSTFGSRVRATAGYTTAASRFAPADGLKYMLVLSPSAVRARSEQLHEVSTLLEADLTETATKVVVVYKIGNGYARPADVGDALTRRDARYDVQVRQSLPFLNFTSAKWEMLVAVRNFFREVESDQSLFDELLAIRAPKRLVGGVTLHF
jgi:hypothetical protein